MISLALQKFLPHFRTFDKINNFLLLSICPNAAILKRFKIFPFSPGADAIDGKHARRLNLASPLGELFDHGMDSISTFLVFLSVGMTVQGGYDEKVFFVETIFIMVLFYMSHWVSYVTGNRSL